MSTSDRMPLVIGGAALVIFTGLAMGAAPPAPAWGRPATPQELAAVDIEIMPDGAGLPAGGGTAKQGLAVYQARCAMCHGAEGVGGKGMADKLAGGQGTLATDKPVRTVGSFWPYSTTLFDFVRRAMPYNAPKSLSNDEVYQVTAYILFLNGLIKDDAVMNKDTLPKVVMPNKNGFVASWPDKER